MNKITLTAACLTLAALAGQAGAFQPKNLAVLRAGDGKVDLKLKQSPVFIDEFAPGAFNPAPVSTVTIPTTGPDTLFFNGHAATEGILTRSADGRLLAFAGYGGVNLLQTNGTPALLDIDRGFCTVDAIGKTKTMLYKKNGSDVKMNPRGVVTDGADHFWGCGNSGGTVYYSPDSPGGAVEFPLTAVESSRAVKIIGNTVYLTLNGADGTASDLPAGIFSFQNSSGTAVPLPRNDEVKLKNEVPAQEPYTKIAGFDMNPAGTVAYTADTVAGVQKYVKTDGAWKFAYNFAIPQNIPDADNHSTGCFGLAVDFSAPAPIIYATTTEGYDGSVNSNRVVQIVDTGATAKVITVAQAPSDQMAFRGIDFTPEAPATKP